MTASGEAGYLALLREALEFGKEKPDRTGTGTRSLFGRALRFDLGKGFPLLTTKRVHFRSVAYELLWFISGDSDIGFLKDAGVGIWDEWADDAGNVGPAYGAHWRSWPLRNGETLDQLAGVIAELVENPHSRRLVVSAWNPPAVPEAALPPCHLLYQFHVEENRLNLAFYQRSGDLFLGVPFNIASYSLLTHMVAGIAGLSPGIVTQFIGDAHLYSNHVKQARLQLGRAPRPLPRLEVTPRSDIDGFGYGDFHLTGYDPHPAIPAPVAV